MFSALVVDKLSTVVNGMERIYKESMTKVVILMSDVPDPEDIQENTRLASQESKVFIKKYHEGKKIPEIAEEMEVTEGTVSKVLGRIKNKRDISKNTVELFEEENDK